MNTNESEFESQLRTLRPFSPSPALGESIARELASDRALATAEAHTSVVRRGDFEIETPPLFDRIFPGLRWAFAGAALVASVFAVVGHFSTKSSADPSASSIAAIEPDFEPDFEPAGITRELLSAEDGGVVYEDEQEPARLVRYTTLERHVWTHPITGARLEVEVPREDIVLIPLAMQ